MDLEVTRVSATKVRETVHATRKTPRKRKWTYWVNSLGRIKKWLQAKALMYLTKKLRDTCLIPSTASSLCLVIWCRAGTYMMQSSAAAAKPFQKTTQRSAPSAKQFIANGAHATCKTNRLIINVLLAMPNLSKRNSTVKSNKCILQGCAIRVNVMSQ